MSSDQCAPGVDDLAPRMELAREAFLSRSLERAEFYSQQLSSAIRGLRMSKHAAVALVSLSLDQYLAEARSVVDVASFGHEDRDDFARAQFDTQVASLTGLFAREASRVNSETAEKSTFMVGAEWFIEGSMRAQRTMHDRFMATRPAPALHVADDLPLGAPRRASRAMSEAH